jgi:hypothetical protein
MRAFLVLCFVFHGGDLCPTALFRDITRDCLRGSGTGLEVGEHAALCAIVHLRCDCRPLRLHTQSGLFCSHSSLLSLGSVGRIRV